MLSLYTLYLVKHDTLWYNKNTEKTKTKPQGGVKMNSQMKRGTLELCALSVMSRGDCYGYELVNRISKCMEITEGTIYPLMKRLKDSGLIDSYIVESNEGPPRKYYKLTETGAEELRRLSEEWFEFTQSIDKLLKGEFEDYDGEQ